MRKSPIVPTEAAFGAYVFQEKDGTALESCHIYAGQSGECTNAGFRWKAPNHHGVSEVIDWETPCVVLGAAEMEEVSPGSGIYEGKLAARVETQIDDTMTGVGTNPHADRLEVLRDLLEDFPAVSAAINKPPAGPDPRLVKGFTLSAIVFEEERPDIRGRRLVTDLLFYVCVCPADPA